MKKFTLNQLFKDKKFRTMGKTKLSNVINYNISYHDFLWLEGGTANDKAENLINKWAEENNLKQNNP